MEHILAMGIQQFRHRSATADGPWQPRPMPHRAQRAVLRRLGGVRPPRHRLEADVRDLTREPLSWSVDPARLTCGCALIASSMLPGIFEGVACLGPAGRLELPRLTVSAGLTPVGGCTP
jgi:hypothetical protein